jgi:hypothetical protein
MFIRARKHTAKNGSLSISFQVLDSYWDAYKKRSSHRVVKNLGTCKIHRYDAERMTQMEYYRLILRKYKKFLDGVKTELKDFPKGEFLFVQVKRIIKRNDNYWMRHY